MRSPELTGLKKLTGLIGTGRGKTVVIGLTHCRTYDLFLSFRVPRNDEAGGLFFSD